MHLLHPIASCQFSLRDVGNIKISVTLNLDYGEPMATPVIIRAYREEDRDQCRSLWRELTEWHQEIYENPHVGGEHPEDYFDKHLAKIGSEHIWVAVQDSRVVGFVGLIVEKGEAEIEPIIVSKGHRRKGSGKRLIETVVSEARKKGVHYLNVKPVARNMQAIRFLYKQGFKIVGHVDLFLDFSNQTWKSGLEFHGCKFDY
jgi:GNAT superfamily N-acetyltransferase